MEHTIERALSVYEHKNNVRDHFYCIKHMFELYNTKELLQDLASRPDVETVCAFEKYRMKQHALENKGLTYEEFHPEYFRGITIPSAP